MQKSAFCIVFSSFLVAADAFLAENECLYNWRCPMPASLAQNPEDPVHPPMLVGSFNIQTLGPKKFKDSDIMYVVEEVIRRYDLIVILEVMTSNDKHMRDLLNDVNRFGTEGVIYNMTLSEKHPDTSESVAILYRTDKLKLLSAESYSDPDKFYRKPLLAVFEAFTLRDMRRIGVVGHHVKPSQAVQEIDALSEVYDYMANDYATQDVLLMGDFNADCTYVKEGDWDNIRLWTRLDFTWPIAGHTDTTTNYKSCALDRFVYAGENMNDGVILSSAQVFNFQKTFDLTMDEVRSISDHWPIEIKIRGKLSDTAERHLSTRVCFKVRDSQPGETLPSQDGLQRLRNTTITKIADGIFLTTSTEEETGVQDALDSWKSALPGVVTRELLEAIRYKIAHGTLKDESSFAEIWKQGFTVNLLARRGYREATVCRNTSVN